MSETANNDAPSADLEKPVLDKDTVNFPPFPDPTDADFDEDVPEEERVHYKNKYSDLNTIKSARLHCSACDRHLGCSARHEARMRQHPMLRTLVCHTCHTFYNSGEFEKGDDGSELYCRWCGQGGQVYCCSDCPHVFCAKCIKRNFGMPKIKEIENTDDWKCFKCNPGCLKDLRAACWALLRYCDLKNKMAYNAQDPVQKEALQKLCAVDDSECCKTKMKIKKEKETKKKETEAAKKNATTNATITNITTRLPPSIQVKKFASINIDDTKEKKAAKRSASPKFKPILVKGPSPMGGRLMTPIPIPPMAKKIRMSTSPAIRFPTKNVVTYPRVRPKPPQIPTMPNMAILSNFNGFTSPNIMTNIVTNDNINLSLESLTQGLDMNAVHGMQGLPHFQDSDVVCTPDFPLEPLCEVTEDNNDDDVQCITPSVAPSAANPPPLPPLIPRFNNQNDKSIDNIIQMTENDVTVNAATGGLKFRVDPQTLSSNKMYRLPDGRIFAINANPNMPGGYSATIVALTENNTGKAVPKGSTYAAKLSTVPAPETSTPSRLPRPNHVPRILSSSISKRSKPQKMPKDKDTSPRQCDLSVPVEWYRYNLIDAVDALEYSISRLNKLKKEATTMHLRTRNVDEMRYLHKTLDRLLNTSATRFDEIRDNLNKEMKQYLAKKNKNACETIASDDDDDVEILNDIHENDDPIFIDENSMESTNVNETVSDTTAEVDLTGVANSEPNDTLDKSMDGEKDPIELDTPTDHITTNGEDERQEEDTSRKDKKSSEGERSEVLENSQNDNQNLENSNNQPEIQEAEQDKQNDATDKENDIDADNDKLDSENKIKEKSEVTNNTKHSDNDNTKENTECDNLSEKENDCKLDDVKLEENAILDEEKNQDTEMSDELIENLLKEDNVGDDVNSTNLNMELTDEF